MHIYLFLAEGFEEIEAIAPIDIFRRANIEVTIVSVSNEKAVTGAHGITVLADSVFSTQTFDKNGFLFLPGGLPGTTNLAAHEGLKALIQRYADGNNKMAAICAAPSVFGKMGLLADKEAICYPGFEQQLQNAILSTSDTIRSGNIFTAKAAGSAMEFALLIVSDLKGKEVSESIRKSMFIN